MFPTRWVLLSLDCHAWAAQRNQLVKCYLAHHGGCSQSACCWCMFFCFCFCFFPQRTGSHLFCAIHLPSVLRSAPRFVVPLIVPKIDDITTSPQPRFRTSEEYKCEACKHWLLRNLSAPPAMPLRLMLWLGDAPRIYGESFWKGEKKKNALCGKESWTLRVREMFCKPVAEQRTSLNELFQSVHSIKRQVCKPSKYPQMKIQKLSCGTVIFSP